MKHKVKVKEVTETRGPFGLKFKVTEERFITVDDATYRRMKREKRKTLTPEEVLAAEYILMEEECPEFLD